MVGDKFGISSLVWEGRVLKPRLPYSTRDLASELFLLTTKKVMA